MREKKQDVTRLKSTKEVEKKGVKKTYGRPMKCQICSKFVKTALGLSMHINIDHNLTREEIDCFDIFDKRFGKLLKHNAPNIDYGCSE